MSPTFRRTQRTGDQRRLRPVRLRGNAIENLIHEGAIGLVLTGLMILIFLGSLRATVAVFLSIPLSALATFIVLSMGGSTVNAMILGGLALAFSRLIDNSVVVLENIFRHLEMGETPEVAAEKGGREVALPVLAATLTTVDGLLSGDLSLRREPVSVHGAGAGGDAVPVRLVFGGHDRGAVVLREAHQRPSWTMSSGEPPPPRLGRALQPLVQPQFNALLDRFEAGLNLALLRPLATVLGITGIFVMSLALIRLSVSPIFRAPIPPVRHQSQGTHRHAHRNDGKIGRSKSKHIVREVVPRRT